MERKKKKGKNLSGCWFRLDFKLFVIVLTIDMSSLDKTRAATPLKGKKLSEKKKNKVVQQKRKNRFTNKEKDHKKTMSENNSVPNFDWAVAFSYPEIQSEDQRRFFFLDYEA